MHKKMHKSVFCIGRECGYVNMIKYIHVNTMREYIQ